MLMYHRVVMLISIIGTVGACSPSCERAVKFQSNQVIIKGTEVPLGKTLGVTKVGDVEVSQPLLQQADTVTKLLDIQQYNSCLNLQRATSREEREFYASQQADALNALINLATRLNTSPGQTATQNAVTEATQKSTAINNATPPALSPTTPALAPVAPSPATSTSAPAAPSPATPALAPAAPSLATPALAPVAPSPATPPPAPLAPASPTPAPAPTAPSPTRS